MSHIQDEQSVLSFAEDLVNDLKAAGISYEAMIRFERLLRNRTKTSLLLEIPKAHNTNESVAFAKLGELLTAKQGVVNLNKYDGCLEISFKKGALNKTNVTGFFSYFIDVAKVRKFGNARNELNFQELLVKSLANADVEVKISSKCDTTAQQSKLLIITMIYPTGNTAEVIDAIDHIKLQQCLNSGTSKNQLEIDRIYVMGTRSVTINIQYELPIDAHYDKLADFFESYGAVARLNKVRQGELEAKR